MTTNLIIVVVCHFFLFTVCARGAKESNSDLNDKEDRLPHDDLPPSLVTAEGKPTPKFMGGKALPKDIDVYLSS